MLQTDNYILQMNEQIITLFSLFLPLSFIQGTLDVGLIDSVCASDNPDR